MKGIIVLWSGAIADIPAGWALCDGTLGTPDLRNKFIVAAGDTYAPGDAGGSVNHGHAFTGDGHSHDLLDNIYIPIDEPNGLFSHNTSVSPAAGTTDNADGRPPYYALCYIMKL